jgi:hypothetical protein
MNPDLLIAYAQVIGSLWLVIYAGRKRLAIGQWLGLGALILGTAGRGRHLTLDSKSPMQFLEDWRRAQQDENLAA